MIYGLIVSKIGLTDYIYVLDIFTYIVRIQLWYDSTQNELMNGRVEGVNHIV